jgi:hypothetical protein
MDIKGLKKMIKEVMGEKSILLSKPSIITEASYSRIKDKIENKKIPFVMITAFRGTESKDENLRRQRELEMQVSAEGYPFTKMPGSGYVEDPEEEGGEPVEVKENSVLVWDESIPGKDSKDVSLFDLAKTLAQKYNQDSFIFGKKLKDDEGQSEMSIRMYDKAGSPMTQSWAGPWSSVKQVDDDDLFWSTLGSKKAKLVKMQEKYQNMPVRTREDAMKKQYYLTALKEALKRFE